MRAAPTARTAVRATPATARTRNRGSFAAARITRYGRWNVVGGGCFVSRGHERASGRIGGQVCFVVTARRASSWSLFNFSTRHFFARRSGRGVIRVYEAMFFGVVSNRGIFACGNDSRASTAFQRSPGNANGRRRRRKGVAKGRFGSVLQRFPFFSRRESHRALPAQFARHASGKNAVLEIQRSLALGVERMHKDETYIPLVVNEHRDDRMIDRPKQMNSGRESPNGNARAKEVAVNDWR